MRRPRVGSAKERAIRAANVAAENRGRKVTVLEMKGLVSWVDYMVLVTASSRRQGAAISDAIEASFKELGDEKIGSEGYQEGSWIVVDFADVVVHIFNDEKRDYYQIEHLWADATPIDWQMPGAAERSGDADGGVGMEAVPATATS